MNTTVEALKNLYVALGGEASAVANISLIPDMIDAIAELEASKAEAASDEAASDENAKSDSEE